MEIVSYKIRTDAIAELVVSAPERARLAPEGLYHTIPNGFARHLPDKTWFYPMHTIVEVEMTGE